MGSPALPMKSNISLPSERFLILFVDMEWEFLWISSIKIELRWHHILFALI